MNVNCKVYFDNFFPSISLMNSLKEDRLRSVATIRKDRLKGADKLLLSEKDLKKKGCGAFDSVIEANSGVTVLRWFDNGLVQMVSNFLGSTVYQILHAHRFLLHWCGRGEWVAPLLSSHASEKSSRVPKKKH